MIISFGDGDGTDKREMGHMRSSQGLEIDNCATVVYTYSRSSQIWRKQNKEQRR